MRFLGFSTVTAVSALLAAPAFAETTTYTLTEPELRANPPAGEAPALTTSETSSIGNGAWTADPDIAEEDQHLIYLQSGLAGPYNNAPKENPAPGLNPNVLFPDSGAPGDGITFNDLVSVSFDTNSEEDDDWFVNLITDFSGDSGDDDDTPEFDLTKGNAASSDAANGFTTYSFADGEGQVFRDGDLGANTEFFSLSELKADFGDNAINFVSVGTNSNNVDFAGAVDNIRFSWLDMDGEEQTTIVDLEAPGATATPIPVPAALPMMAAGLGALAGFGRLRRKA